MDRVAEAYVPYMEKVFVYYEQQSVATIGYGVRQILLLHANMLNADYLDTLLERIRSRDYAFITLDAALEDPAYTMPDTFTGHGGISWLHRWALAAGNRGAFCKGEPECPNFVMEEAGVTSQ